MGVNSGFQQTEAGLIPSDWTTSFVGEEFDIKLGKMLDAEKNEGIPKPYIGNRAVQWNKIDIGELPTVPLTPADLKRFRLEKGDLLVCEGGDVGRAAIWDAPIAECYYQKALHRLRPLRGFDVRLMVALLWQWSRRGVLANFVTQTSIAHLPREKFIEIPMPVPPSAEQRAIAEALSDVDALLGILDRMLTKKRDLKQAAMQQLLTGQTRLPGFAPANRTYKPTDVGHIPEDWKVEQLGKISKLTTGSGLLKGEIFESGDIPAIPYTSLYTDFAEIVDYDSIKWFADRTTTGHIVNEPCVLIASSSNMEANTGKATALTSATPVAIGREVIIVRGNFNCAYLSYLLSTTPYRKRTLTRAKGTTIKHVYTTSFVDYPIAAPSLAEQTAIAEVLSDMDAEIAALERRREKTQDLKQGMMQELLTGKTRLL